MNRLNSQAWLRDGFTLAEVLITLTVIGVLAAMTVPSLMQATQDQELKTSFKKAYLVASQAWKQVVAENPQTYTARGGFSCTWPTGETIDYNTMDGRVNAFKSKFNVTKSCVNQDGCWSSAEYFAPYGGSDKNYSWVTSDGMCWSAPYKYCDETHIDVDTNCVKGPNKVGKDIFLFSLGADGVLYFGFDDRSTSGKPVSSGNVCPQFNSPTTINGKPVDFKSWLIN